jgi:hypothetical protein
MRRPKGSIAGTWIFALNGEEQPAPKFGGLALTYYPDEGGNIVGMGLVNASGLDRQAVVKCKLPGKESACSAESAVMAGDRLACIVTDEEGQWTLLGEKKEGPYKGVTSVVFMSPDEAHYAYLVRTEKGRQVVIDGRLMPQVYEDFYRPKMAGDNEFGCLGIRDNKIFGLRYMLSQPDDPT